MAKNSIPEDSLQRQLAHGWETLDWRALGEIRRNSPLRGGLFKLLAPIAALRVFGTPADLKEKRAVIRQAKKVNRELPMNEGGRKKIAASLEELTVCVQSVLATASGAEQSLNAYGWKYQEGTGKIYRIRGGQGKDLLTECVWDIYINSYRKEYPKLSSGKKASVRRKIAAVLAPYFDPSELSPESGAPIYMAIYKGEKRPM